MRGIWSLLALITKLFRGRSTRSKKCSKKCSLGPISVPQNGSFFAPPICNDLYEGSHFRGTVFGPLFGDRFSSKNDFFWGGASTKIPSEIRCDYNVGGKKLQYGNERDTVISTMISKLFGNRVAKILYHCRASGTGIWK